MSFKRLDNEDFVVSAESITGVAWSNGSPTATSFSTSADQEASVSGKYYINAFLNNTNASAQTPIEFAVAYGNINGLGAAPFDPNVPGKSPTSVVYGQWQNIVLGDENTKFKFGDTEHDDFYVINLARNRFKEKILPGSWTLNVNGTAYADNSKVATTVSFNEAGRVFPIFAGSAGVPTGNTSVGLFLPDIGAIIVNSSLTSPTTGTGDAFNPKSFINNISSFTINFEETISSDFVFVRARNAEYNYSENPSFISGSTGAVIYNDFINNPQTFISSIGLYNDTNDLLAVAKLSTPLKKDFTKEALIRVKLDF